MGLTVSHRNLAEVRIQGVTLRPVVGGFELIFGLYMTVYAEDQLPRRASIVGARVTLKTEAGVHQLGFARPEAPFDVIARQHQSTMTPGLYMTLQPGQLAAIERLRGTGDLEFEMLAAGNGFDKDGEHYVQDTWRVQVPRSEWIKKLKDARARNILLLEVPMPLHPSSKRWADITSGLKKAEEQYRNGDYHSCIGSCRTVIQELGHHRFKKKEWVAEPLTRLGADRSSMTKGEREAALWAVLRHYTHQAHHGPSEGGVPEYTRPEAQFVLTLTAAAVAHAQAE